MASIRERGRADGTTGYAVLWRHAGVQTSLTFDTRPAAERAVRLIDATDAGPDQVAALAAGAGGQPTVADAVRRHVAELAGISERTRADYLRDASRHIDPSLGPLPVAAVDRAAVAQWVRALAAAQLADKTIRNLHGLLSAALAAAAERGWRDGNPCKGMRLPRRGYGQAEMVILTRGEWALLLAEVPPRWRPLYVTLAGTGIRWSEAAGLLVGHVDLLASAPVLRVVQSDRRTPAGRQLGPTKTRRSRRTVTLPRQVVDALVPLVAARGPGERLFTTRAGGPLNRSHYGQVWQPAVRRAQDPARHGPAALAKTPRIHDLRHCHASWLIAEGVDLFTVSRRLGHEDIGTTANVYGHLMPDQERRAAEAAARALAPLGEV